MDPKCLPPEGLWAALGRRGSLLGPSWGPHGSSWAPLGTPLALLGALLEPPGRSWGSFWGSCSSFDDSSILFNDVRRSRGLNIARKIYPKSILAASWRFLVPLGVLLGLSWPLLAPLGALFGRSWRLLAMLRPRDLRKLFKKCDVWSKIKVFVFLPACTKKEPQDART